MRTRTLAIIGIAAYLAFAAALMPARWLAAKAATTAPSPFVVQEADGTLWKGNARALLTAPGGTLVVDRVEWDFLPSRLLQGRLAYAVRLRGAGFEADYEAGHSLAGWSVRDLTARADAALAAAALPLIARWRPEGSVSAVAAEVHGTGSEVHGTIRVELKDAATNLSAVKPLGAYRLEVAGEGASGKLSLSTLEGPLRLAGQGRVEWPARFTFSGEARGEGPNARALDPLLDILGPAKADGARSLDWQLR